MLLSGVLGFREHTKADASTFRGRRRKMVKRPVIFVGHGVRFHSRPICIEVSIDGDALCSEVVLGFRDFLVKGNSKRFRFVESRAESRG